MILLIISLLSVLVFARPQQKICCVTDGSCVAWDTCYGPNAVAVDVDGDGDKDYCEGGSAGDSGYWWDCWGAGESSACGDIEVKPGIFVEQYCDGASHDCVTKKGACVSCNADYECSGGSCLDGLCRDVTEETGLCSDGIDNDCDSFTDCADSDCVGDSACCGYENSECCTSGDDCFGSLYCSTLNPTYLTPVDPHCCQPYFWWDEVVCIQYDECNPECVSNPFDDACVSPNELFGCCSFIGGDDSYQEITTY